MAWRGRSDIDAYIASGGAYMTQSLRERLEASLPVIRRRGYSMAANGTGMRRLSHDTLVPIGQASDTPHAGSLEWIDNISLEEFQMLEFAEAKGKGVNYLAAPVFSAEGEIVFEMLISRLPVDMSQADFEFYETQLLNVADTITRQIRGVRPKPW
jgi:DNA-binding IclR family transcriptional regulator